MFVDLDAWPPPPPPEPKPRGPALTKRDETVLFCILGANLLLLLIGPFAGSSVVHAVASLLAWTAGLP